MDILQTRMTPFATFEAREEAFRQHIPTLLPRTHAGPRVFWKDFSAIFGRDDEPRSLQKVVYITANPRDCLAFSTPRKVLLAAGVQAEHSYLKPASSPEAVAHIFNLEKNLDQPIRTLSGGERVRVALAKVHLLVGTAAHLIMASPFCWLDEKSRIFLEIVTQRYQKRQVPVALFILQGEDDTQPIADDQKLGPGWLKPVSFHLVFKKVNLVLGSTLTAFNLPSPPRVRLSDFEARLTSPCLWVGGNGQGKSLTAKVLSGATSYGGTARISSSGQGGRARLLFQDVITQTLLRSFDVIQSQAMPAGSDVTANIYRRIMKMVNCNHHPEPSSPTASPPTLLEIKAMLVAVRLSRWPAALILDEPDWGLSQSAAIGFVAGVVDVSHGQGVPVILITHKPWWNRVAKSRIRIAKSGIETEKDGRITSFQLEFTHVDPP